MIRNEIGVCYNLNDTKMWAAIRRFEQRIQIDQSDTERLEAARLLQPFLKRRFRRPNLKQQDMMLLVALRYGSLTDYSQPMQSFDQIAQHTRLN